MRMQWNGTEKSGFVANLNGWRFYAFPTDTIKVCLYIGRYDDPGEFFKVFPTITQAKKFARKYATTRRL
jgi:hypothetical protein